MTQEKRDRLGIFFLSAEKKGDDDDNETRNENDDVQTWITPDVSI